MWAPELRNDLWQPAECRLSWSPKNFSSPGSFSSRAAHSKLLQLLRENWWHLLPSPLLFRSGQMMKLKEIISISHSYCWDDRQCTDFPREYHASVKNIRFVRSCKMQICPQPGNFSHSPWVLSAKKLLAFLPGISPQKKETQHVICELLLILWIIDAIFCKGPKRRTGKFSWRL